jgi:uncharacterized NAD-dependent epimerase/dehydratase family protein
VEGEKTTIDDFLLDVALMLGVSQHAIENEYYMIDLPRMLERKARIDAMKRIEDLRFNIATNNRSLDEAEFKKYMNELTKRTGIKVAEKFDREKFEQLRAMTHAK